MAEVVTYLNRLQPQSVIQKEIFRKSIHATISLAAILSMNNLYITFFLLVVGSVAYLLCEFLRINGYTIPIITTLTLFATRERDKNGIVLGPLTLALGAMLALTLFPSSIAAIAIFSLAFGDGIASLVGKAFGSVKPKILKGKSLEGSAACFVATFLSTLTITQNIVTSLVLAFITTIVEVLPLKNFDNIAIPLITGFAAAVLML